jgi:hypothetical protein
MTDPERISKRSSGLAAELLRAGVDEQPSDASVERTLAALGVAGAVLTTTTVAAGGVQLAGATAASASGAKAATLTLLAKWVGVGVVGGIGLASVASVMTAPRSAEPAPHVSVAAVPAVSAAAKKLAPAPQTPAPAVAAEEPTLEVVPAPVAAPRVAPSEAASVSPEPVLEVGTPLAAEVAYVDRARALVASGQSGQGLALLRSYEQEFPEARLLPEVLFLELETLDRLGRTSEARAAAQRLVDGFPKSPHANRARKLLSP